MLCAVRCWLDQLGIYKAFIMTWPSALATDPGTAKSNREEFSSLNGQSLGLLIWKQLMRNMKQSSQIWQVYLAANPKTVEGLQRRPHKMAPWQSIWLLMIWGQFWGSKHTSKGILTLLLLLTLNPLQLVLTNVEVGGEALVLVQQFVVLLNQTGSILLLPFILVQLRD